MPTTLNRNNPSAPVASRATRLTVLCLAAVLAAPAPLDAARRDRRRGSDHEKYIPVEAYKEMTVFERAAFDKAMKLHLQGEYRVAAAQFHKFALQFQDSAGMPFAMLMEARCLHKDHKRVTAIKKYTEILDYFPEAPSVAAPALYYRAAAKFENGDKLQGFRDYRVLVENANYLKHDLGVPAKLGLADYYYENDKQQQAVKYWQDLLKRRINVHERRSLAHKIRTWYVTSGNFSGYQRFRLGDTDLSDAKTYPAQLVVVNEAIAAVDASKAEIASKACRFLLTKKSVYTATRCLLSGGEAGKYSRGYYELGLSLREGLESDRFDRFAAEAVGAFASLPKGDDRYYSVGCGLAELIGGAKGDKLNDEMVKRLSKEQDLAKYVERACKVAAGAGGRTRDALHKAIIVRMGAEGDDKKYLAIAMGLNAEGKLRYSGGRELKESKAFKPMAIQILGRISRQPAGKKRDDLYCAYIPGWSGYEQGYKLIGRIGEVKRRFKHHLRMLEHERKWKEYVVVLDEFEKQTPSTREGIETKNWIRRHRAFAYHHKVRRYAEAIKLYHDINDPPHTLWSIQDCQGRLGKWKQQLQTLTEIEASFPKHGPRAAQQIVRVFQRQKMDKQAIGKCRTIMKIYKEDSVSSWAHQELEKYGKGTGGGLIDDD